MHVRDEIRMAVTALLIVQIVTSFGAIGLLSRMSPAIERILQENVYSIAAVEDMFAVLAVDGSNDAANDAKFTDALSRARANVTEANEEPELKVIEEAVGQDISDPEVRGRLVDALHELGRINRASMREADVFAKRLGTAGAWAAVVLGMLGFILSVLAVRRLSHQILDPLDELAATVNAYAAGDLHRRCQVEGAPAELREVAETVNNFIDEELQAASEKREQRHDVTRAATLHFLDALDGIVLLLDAAGAIVATNEPAVEFLRTERGQELRASLPDFVADASETPDDVELEEIRDEAILAFVNTPHTEPHTTINKKA